MKIFEFNSPEVSAGNKVKQTISLKKGLSQEMSKKLSKAIRDQLKKINVSNQSEKIKICKINIMKRAQEYQQLI